MLSETRNKVLLILNKLRRKEKKSLLSITLIVSGHVFTL
jgi:hypothetical protein